MKVRKGLEVYFHPFLTLIVDRSALHHIMATLTQQTWG